MKTFGSQCLSKDAFSVWRTYTRLYTQNYSYKKLWSGFFYNVGGVLQVERPLVPLDMLGHLITPLDVTLHIVASWVWWHAWSQWQMGDMQDRFLEHENLFEAVQYLSLANKATLFKRRSRHDPKKVQASPNWISTLHSHIRIQPKVDWPRVLNSTPLISRRSSSDHLTYWMDTMTLKIQVRPSRLP